MNNQTKGNKMNNRKIVLGYLGKDRDWFLSNFLPLSPGMKIRKETRYCGEYDNQVRSSIVKMQVFRFSYQRHVVFMVQKRLTDRACSMK